MQFFLQILHPISAAPLLFRPSHKSLRVQEIRIYQAGIEHPSEKHRLQWVGECRKGGRRQLELPLPSLAGLQLSKSSLSHAAAKGGLILVIPFSSAVGEPAVVPRHGKRGADLISFAALRGSGCGVIHTLSAPLDPALEGSGIFPQVVGQTRQPALLLRAERGGECGAPVSRSIQMLCYRLPSPVLGKVGKISYSHVAMSFFPTDFIYHGLRNINKSYFTYYSNLLPMHKQISTAGNGEIVADLTKLP